MARDRTAQQSHKQLHVTQKKIDNLKHCRIIPSESRSFAANMHISMLLSKD